MEKLYYWVGFAVVWLLNIAFYALVFAWLKNIIKRNVSISRYGLFFVRWNVYWRRKIVRDGKTYDLCKTAKELKFVRKKFFGLYILYRRPKRVTACKPA